MDVQEDWQMLSAAFSGTMGASYGALEGDIFIVVLSLLVIWLVYKVIKLRDYLREGSG